LTLTNWRETIKEELTNGKLRCLKTGDRFRFECHPDCMGRCCNRADITMDPWDVENMARGLALSCADFVDQYGEMYYAADTNWPTMRLRHAAQGPCTFLLPDGRCRIYPYRPRNCRAYPVGRSLYIGPADSAGVQAVQADYFMLNTRDFCLGPGANRTWTLDEWLRDSDCTDFFRLSTAHLRVKALARDLHYREWNPGSPPMLLSLFLYEPDLLREEFDISEGDVDHRNFYYRRMEALKFLLINLAAEQGHRLNAGEAEDSGEVCTIDQARMTMLELMVGFLNNVDKQGYSW